MAKSTIQCCITKNQYITNLLLKYVINQINSRVSQYNEEITDYPSTIVLTSENDIVYVHRSTFNLIIKACTIFKVVKFSNLHPNLFLGLLRKLRTVISNIETINATLYDRNLTKTCLYSFDYKEPFNMNVSIECSFNNDIEDFLSDEKKEYATRVEDFLNNGKQPYTIYFPPYNKLFLDQNDLSGNYIPDRSKYVIPPLLSNARFINRDMMSYENHTNLTTYTSDNTGIACNSSNNGYIKYRIDNNYTSILQACDANKSRYQPHKVQDTPQVGLGI